MMDPLDKELLVVLQDEIPLVPRPFLAVAERLGIPEEEVLRRVKRLVDGGIVRRFSASLRHRELGIKANALCAWQVPEERVEEIGRKLASFPEVTHCYERPTVPGKWEYNLFTMVHGYDRPSVERKIREFSEAVGVRDYILLYSTREFKKIYKRYGSQ